MVNLLKYPTLFLLLILCSCGIYTGTEKVSYNPDTFTGFRTPEYDAGVEAMKKELAESGKEDKIPDLPDNSVTLLTGDDIKEATGGTLQLLAPIAPFGGGILLVLISHFITRRKKDDERYN